MHLLQGLDLPKRIMGWYGLASRRSLGLPTRRCRLPSARLERSARSHAGHLGGIFGVKPELARRHGLASHRLPSSSCRRSRAASPRLITPR